MKPKAKKSVSIFATITIAFIAMFLGALITRAAFPTPEVSECPQLKCPVLDTSNVHTDYDSLKDNACRLYGNYKNLYLAIDSECNANYSCRGSASQKSGYETFQGWQSFYNSYCNE